MTSLSSYFTNRLSSIAVRASLSRRTHYALYTDHTLHIDDITKIIFTQKKYCCQQDWRRAVNDFFKYKFENMFC